MDRKERRELIAEGVKQNLDYDEIAELLEIPRAMVFREVMILRQRVDHDLRETTARYREIARVQYQDLLDRFWNQALQGDMPSARMVLDIMRDRRALLGLDQPKAVEAKISVTGQVAHAHLDGYSAEALRKAEQVLAKIVESGGDFEEAEIQGLIESGESR